MARIFLIAVIGLCFTSSVCQDSSNLDKDDAPGNIEVAQESSGSAKSIHGEKETDVKSDSSHETSVQSDHGEIEEEEKSNYFFTLAGLHYLFTGLRDGYEAANQPLPKEGDQTNGSQPSLDDMTKPSGQVICKERSVDKDKYLNSVYMVNDTALQELLKSDKNKSQNSMPAPSVSNSSTEAIPSLCQLLLLYAPWCTFSARLAPHYNALARAFPDVDLIAINAVTLNYWKSRFGTIAVPNLLLFHDGRFVARLNYSEKTMESLSWFVQNHTNLKSLEGIDVTEEDYEGPVPSVIVEDTDYYLYLSWLVIVVAATHLLYFKLNSPFLYLYTKISNLFPYERLHVD